jgi:hypothetical protein
MSKFDALTKEVAEETSGKVDEAIKDVIRTASQAVNNREKWINARKEQLKHLEEFLQDLKENVDKDYVVSEDCVDKIVDNHYQARGILVETKRGG